MKTNDQTHNDSFIPENPKKEAKDPNIGKSLTDSLKAARRNLIIVCGIAIAWATAQFTKSEPKIEFVGITVELSASSIPIILTTLILYLTYRWGMEFAMMTRVTRRWPLAQLDFKIITYVIQFSILAVAAGAIDQSLWIIAKISGAIIALALSTMVSTVLLMIITMPICLWKTRRANRTSVASTAFTAFFWAGFFAVVINILGTVAFGIASYTHAPLRDAIWHNPPNPIALSYFVIVLILTFISHWLLKPLKRKLLAIRPNYTTERMPNGHLYVTVEPPKKEPLL